MQKEKYDSAYIYLNENYFNSPKEIFKFIGNEIEKIVNLKEKVSLLDLGCARGEFLYYIKNLNKNFVNLTGIDLLEELINSGKSFDGLKDVSLHVGYADNFELNKKFNIITMLGLLPALPTIDNIFKVTNKHQNKNDKLLIFTKFNHNDAEVIVKYKNNKQNKDWQVTTTYSLSKIKQRLKEAGYKFIEIKKFELPFELNENTDDPIRSWTLQTENGQVFINGIGQIFHLELIIAEKVHSI